MRCQSVQAKTQQERSTRFTYLQKERHECSSRSSTADDKKRPERSTSLQRCVNIGLSIALLLWAGAAECSGSCSLRDPENAGFPQVVPRHWTGTGHAGLFPLSAE